MSVVMDRSSLSVKIFNGEVFLSWPRPGGRPENKRGIVIEGKGEIADNILSPFAEDHRQVSGCMREVNKVFCFHAC